MTVSEIDRAIDEARADIDLLARLQSAAERLATLEKDRSAALASEQLAATRQAEAAQIASYEGVTAIRVAEVHSELGPIAFPHTPYDITYTKPEYCMHTRQSAPKEFRVRGFGALPRGAMLYLLQQASEQIPPQIMALAPNDPASAMGAYFTARKRGHL